MFRLAVACLTIKFHRKFLLALVAGIATIIYSIKHVHWAHEVEYFGAKAGGCRDLLPASCTPTGRKKLENLGWLIRTRIDRQIRVSLWSGVGAKPQ